MALDRWIALVFIAFCAVYGYLAFFTMDQLLPPFMQRNPVWPSTFPKVLAVLGVIVGLIVLFGLEGRRRKRTVGHRHQLPPPARVQDRPGADAVWADGAYALMLRPAGFLISTTVFLMAGSAILGERKWLTMLLVAALATGCVWYLVQEVLGIFLRPFPFFMGV
jgi:putative tricarboxylic transport membrane protein